MSHTIHCIPIPLTTFFKHVFVAAHHLIPDSIFYTTHLHTLSLSLSLPLTLTFSHSHSLSPSLSLSLSLSLTLTFSHSHSLSPSLYLLLEPGADATNENEGQGWTAFHMASFLGHAEILSCLMRSIENLTVLTHSGLSASDIAWSDEIKQLIQEEHDRRPRYKRAVLPPPPGDGGVGDVTVVGEGGEEDEDEDDDEEDEDDEDGDDNRNKRARLR